MTTTNLDTLISEFDAAKKEFANRAQSFMKEAFKKVFDNHPEITAFVWTQYSPYFNDGEECVFGVNEVSFTNLPEEELGDIYGGEYTGERDDVADSYGDNSESEFFVLNEYSMRNKLKLRAINTPLDDVSALINALQSSSMEDVMEQTFGNHVRVVATRAGFDIDEYHHD